MRPIVQIVAETVTPYDGGFDLKRGAWIVYSEAFPTRIKFHAVFAMELDVEDAGREVDSYIRVVAPDGFAGASATVHHRLPTFEPGVPYVWLTTEPFELVASPGTHEIRFLVDEEEVALARLLVLPLPTPSDEQNQ